MAGMFQAFDAGDSRISALARRYRPTRLSVERTANRPVRSEDHKVRTVLLVVSLVFGTLPIAAAESRFTINGVSNGQSIDVARANIPSLQCINQCVTDKSIFYGSPGKFWASLRDGRINEFAFRFTPEVDANKARIIVDDIKRQFGPPESNLEMVGCDEWLVDGGYLAVCLTPEVSHLMWSHSSRVDMNKRGQSK